MSRKLFPNKTNLCKQRKVTLPEDKILCSWPGCQRIFVSSKNLEKHLRAHNQGSHKCIYCHRQFPSQSKLKNHIRIHTGEKPYTCSFCPKSFSEPGNLKVHTRFHSGEKPFECKICQKSFSYKTSLQDHIRLHTGERPYNCDICARSFARSSYLVVHQRNHNENKPYKCTFCSKSFSQRVNLQTHMRIHTGERPYNCKICPKSFHHQSSLQFHMKKHTNKMTRQHIRKVEKSEEQNKPNNCKKRAKRRNKDVGRHNEGASKGGATTRRVQTKYKDQTKQLSSLTCQVCHQVSQSLQNLCRHYSLQHNLPKVVMHNLII